nr:ABC transporter permease [Anaerolineae bacterium]
MSKTPANTLPTASKQPSGRELLMQLVHNPRQQHQLIAAGQIALSIVLALLIGAGLILIVGENPLVAYSALFRGAFGSGPALARTLRVSSPLILSGLAIAVAFRAGMINLGVEGSLYLGAFSAALAGIYIQGLSPALHLPVALLIGAITGGVWAFIPGLLKARAGVDEIVATLMLNYIAVLLVDYLVLTYFLDPVIGTTSDRPATVPIPESAKLPFISEKYGLTIGIAIGVVLALILAWMYLRSKWGYESDMTGFNRRFAHFGGVNTTRVGLIAMILSGMLGGLAGATESLGVYGRYVSGFSTGIGFDGIAVALMGNLNPIGTMIGAVFFGALKNGGASMELATNVPRDVILVVEGLILLVVTARQLFVFLRLSTQDSKED